MWHHDPVKCIRELMGNPTFCEFMAYTPEHVFTDERGEECSIFDEMWMADWWWRIQVSKVTDNKKGRLTLELSI